MPMRARNGGRTAFSARTEAIRQTADTGLTQQFGVGLRRTRLWWDVGLGKFMADLPVNRELWSRLIREVRIRTRGRSDPEELLHAAYLRLVRYRTQHTVENVGAFLVRTAVNIGVDNYRHDRFIADIAPENAGICENSPLQDEVLAARARLERVREGLSRLSPRTREVFLMHRLEDMKYREIAERLGISQSAVEKHIAKAALFLTTWTEGW